MDNDEFKQMIVKNIISDLQEVGFEVDLEKLEEFFMKVREIVNEKVKEFGFDFFKGFSFDFIINIIMEKLRVFGVLVGMFY